MIFAADMPEFGWRAISQSISAGTSGFACARRPFARIGVAAVADGVERGAQREVRRKAVELRGEEMRRLGVAELGTRAGKRREEFVGCSAIRRRSVDRVGLAPSHQPPDRAGSAALGAPSCPARPPSVRSWIGIRVLVELRALAASAARASRAPRSRRGCGRGCVRGASSGAVSPRPSRPRYCPRRPRRTGAAAGGRVGIGAFRRDRPRLAGFVRGGSGGALGL